MKRRSLCPAISAVLLCLLSPAVNGQSDPLTTLETGDVYFLEFLEGGRNLLCNTRVWDVKTGEVIQSMGAGPISGYRYRVALSADRETLAMITKEYTVSVYNMESASHVRDIAVSQSRPLALAFSPDGRTLAVEGKYGVAVDFVDIGSGKKLDSIRFDDAHAIEGLAFGPDGIRLLVAYYHVLNSGPEGGMSMSFTIHRSALVSLPDKEIVVSYSDKGLPIAYSPDGSLYAVYHSDDLYVYDAESLSVVSQVPGGSRESPALAFSPDRTIKLLYGPDLYEARKGPTAELLRHFPLRWSGNEVAYSPDGNKVAIEDTRNGTVTIWDVSDLNTAVQDWPERESRVRRVDGVK